MNEVIALLVLYQQSCSWFFRVMILKGCFQGTYFLEAIHFHSDPYY